MNTPFTKGDAPIEFHRILRGVRVALESIVVFQMSQCCAIDCTNSVACTETRRQQAAGTVPSPPSLRATSICIPAATAHQPQYPNSGSHGYRRHSFQPVYGRDLHFVHKDKCHLAFMFVCKPDFILRQKNCVAVGLSTLDLDVESAILLRTIGRTAFHCVRWPGRAPS